MASLTNHPPLSCSIVDTCISPTSTTYSASTMVIRPDMAAGDPDDIHLPGIFVKRIVALTPEQAARKNGQKRTTRARPTEQQQKTR